MPKFSVIIPVYGAEAYLAKCVDSILTQPCRDLEVILVDDCSKDGSGKICDDFAARDARVRVLHKPQNEGLGYARRDGLAAAAGEWILFVDSDDWIEANTLQTLSDSIEPDVDILVFGMTLCFENAAGETVRTEVISPERAKAHGAREMGDLLMRLDSQRSFPYMCNKLYRAQFLADAAVPFNTIQSMEDFFYNIEVFEKAGGVRVLSEPFYCYRKPARETLVSAYNPDFFALSKRRTAAERAFLQRSGADTEENLQKLDKIFLNHLISCLIKNAASNSPLSGREQRQRAAEMLRDRDTRAMLRHIRCGGLRYRVILLIFRLRLAFAAVWVGQLACRLGARSLQHG